MPAWATALEVLVANDVTVLVDARDGYTPTPAVSHAILRANERAHDGPGPRRRHRRHAVPQPAPRRRLQVQPAARRPGRHRRDRLDRRPGQRADRGPTSRASTGSRSPAPAPPARRTTSSARTSTTCPASSTSTRSSAPASGSAPTRSAVASVDYWARDRRAVRPRPHRRQPERRPDLALHDPRLGRQDPDGLLVAVRDGVAGRAQGRATTIATGNDADADRHGIVTPDAGLMNPNHYLAVAIDYLFATGRTGRRRRDRQDPRLVVDDRPGRRRRSAGALVEVPVGFKWFVPGLLDGSVGFGGEESAGASFLRLDGTVWTTDKDGILLRLLASEILAVTGKTPERALRRAGRARSATRRTRASTRRRPRAEGASSASSRRDDVTATELAGEPITAKLTAGARQRRGDRRPQGHDRARVVRRPAVRHRGRLQDLRRVVQGPRAPGRGAGGRARGRVGGAGLMTDADRHGTRAPRRPRRPVDPAGHRPRRPERDRHLRVGAGRDLSPPAVDAPAAVPGEPGGDRVRRVRRRVPTALLRQPWRDPGVPDDLDRLGVDAVAHRARLLRAVVLPALHRHHRRRRPLRRRPVGAVARRRQDLGARLRAAARARAVAVVRPRGSSREMGPMSRQTITEGRCSRRTSEYGEHRVHRADLPGQRSPPRSPPRPPAPPRARRHRPAPPWSPRRRGPSRPR